MDRGGRGESERVGKLFSAKEGCEDNRIHQSPFNPSEKEALTLEQLDCWIPNVRRPLTEVC
jgi:hypothetical protein